MTCFLLIHFFYFAIYLTASINAIACPIGGLLCSYVLDKYGRKKTLYTINMLSVISWGMMAMASSVDKELMFIQLLVARFIIGICIGLSSSPSAVYSAEIAHPSLRGRISVITSVTIGLGILVIYVLGYFIPVRMSSALIKWHYSAYFTYLWYSSDYFLCRRIGVWWAASVAAYVWLHWFYWCQFQKHPHG